MIAVSDRDADGEVPRAGIRVRAGDRPRASRHGRCDNCAGGRGRAVAPVDRGREIGRGSGRAACEGSHGAREGRTGQDRRGDELGRKRRIGDGRRVGDAQRSAPLVHELNDGRVGPLLRIDV